MIGELVGVWAKALIFNLYIIGPHYSGARPLVP